MSYWYSHLLLWKYTSTNDIIKYAITNDVIKHAITNELMKYAITNDVIKYAIKNDYAITNDVIKKKINNNFVFPNTPAQLMLDDTCLFYWTQNIKLPNSAGRKGLNGILIYFVFFFFYFLFIRLVNNLYKNNRFPILGSGPPCCIFLLVFVRIPFSWLFVPFLGLEIENILLLICNVP